MVGPSRTGIELLSVDFAGKMEKVLSKSRYARFGGVWIGY
jgi:hypothetical protein